MVVVRTEDSGTNEAMRVFSTSVGHVTDPRARE